MSKIENKTSDDLLIRYLAWGTLKRYSLGKLSRLAGRARGWASNVKAGQIKSARKDTREKILMILGDDR